MKDHMKNANRVLAITAMKRTIIQLIVATTICLTCSPVIAQTDAGSIAEFTAHPEAKFEKKTPAEIEAFEREVAVKIKTLAERELCDLALVPPVLNTDPLPDFDYDRLDYGMTIGIARTPRGSYLVMLGCG